MELSESSSRKISRVLLRLSACKILAQVLDQTMKVVRVRYAEPALPLPQLLGFASATSYVDTLKQVKWLTLRNYELL